MKRLGILLLVATAAFAAVRALRRPPPGDGPRDFTLPSIAGEEVRLASLRGRVVAVNFWATWCPPCKQEIPELAALHASARAEGRCLELLGIAEDSGTRDEVAAAARELGIPYPVLLDPGAKVGDAWRVPGYPRTFLLDAEGKLRHTYAGAVTRAELERALAPLLAEPAAACGKVPR